MSIPLESVAPGKCYLTETGQIRRVLRVLPDGRVQYEYRGAANPQILWKDGIQDRRSFASLVEREVPRDWTPEMDK